MKSLRISTWFEFLLLGSIFPALCQTAGSDQMIMCRSDSVIEGETGVMTFSFKRHIDVTKETFLINLTNETKHDVVVCDKMDEDKPMKTRLSNPKFITDCLVNNTLKVVVPDATLDLAGKYELSFFGKPKNAHTRCNFTVLRRAEFVGTPESGSETKTVIVPAIAATIAAVVAICIVIVVLVVRRRRRNRGGDFVPTTETETMNTNDKDHGHTDINTCLNGDLTV